MSTASTTAIYTLLRERFRLFATPGGDKLTNYLGSGASDADPFRCYDTQAPDNVAYPFVVFRLLGRLRQGDDADIRSTPILEVHVHGWPRSQQGVAGKVELIGDLCEQALTKWVNYDDGLLFAGAATRDAMPIFGAPADRERVMARLLCDLILWPQYLSQYAVSS